MENEIGIFVLLGGGVREAALDVDRDKRAGDTTLVMRMSDCMK